MRSVQCCASHRNQTAAGYAVAARNSADWSSGSPLAAAALPGKLGFPAAAVPAPAAFASGFRDPTQFPGLNAIAKAGALPGGDVLGVQPAAAGSKAYQAACRQCTAGANALFAPMIKAGEAVAGGWGLIVMNIQSSAPVPATMPAVRACATRHGWPSDPHGPVRQIDSLADFAGWVAGQLDGAGSRGASPGQMQALRRA